MKYDWEEMYDILRDVVGVPELLHWLEVLRGLSRRTGRGRGRLKNLPQTLKKDLTTNDK